MSSLIPKGFEPVALTELHGHKATAFFNRERHLLMFQVNDTVVGPIEPSELESFLHVLKDVGDMRGRYHPIKI